VLDAASERGEFSGCDAEMVAGVLRLSELHANDEMTPRVDVESYDLELSGEERRAALLHGRHRWLPVIRRTPDAIEGVYDRETGRIEDALFVPETVTLDDLLVTFRKSGKHLAVVLDEYGGTAGVISPDDILEIIFGPGVFSRPQNDPAIVQKSGRIWEIDARANLDEINRELGVELDAGDADRLSGWVAYHAERLPHVGQQVVADGCRATILKRRRRRVVSVRLEVLDYPKTDSEMDIIAETDEAVEKAEEDA
jgi:CBS domain containing-hemolysin-like protein